MCKTASHKAEEEKLVQEISELEEKLASLEANIPAHSMSVLLMQKIEEAEDEIKEKKKALIKYEQAK